LSPQFYKRAVLARFCPEEMGRVARENDLGSRLARDLAQIVSEPIFDIPRLVEAAHPWL